MRNLILALGLIASTSAWADTWTYYDRTSPMGDRVRSAVLASDNRLQQKFPYDSGYVMLVLQKSKHGFFLGINSGKESHRCYRCTVRIKFDDGAPQTFSAEESDGTLLLNSPKAIALVKKSRKILVELDLYSSGTQFVEFTVENELKEF